MRRVIKAQVPKIIGNDADIAIVMRALDFLLREFPKEYAGVVSNIRKISIISDAKSSENQVYPRTGNYVMRSGLLRGYRQVTKHLASLLIHEAYHVTQYRKGVKNIDSRAERSAYMRQLNFLKKVKSTYLYEHVRQHFNMTYAKGTKKRPL